MKMWIIVGTKLKQTMNKYETFLNEHKLRNFELTADKKRIDRVY